MRDADFLEWFADDFIPEFLIEPLHVLAGVELDGVEFSEEREVGFDGLHEDVSQALALLGFGDGDLADFHAAVGLGDGAGAGEDGAVGVCVADAEEPEVDLRWAFEQDFGHGEGHAERAAEDFLPEKLTQFNYTPIVWCSRPSKPASSDRKSARFTKGPACAT